MCDSLEIVSVLDWQRVSILPLFLAADVPKHRQNHSDLEFSTHMVPKLPEDFEQMSEEDQEEARDTLRKLELHF